jgi:beta-1,4-mannooligosaccharide/beta-1,4-mannosyl-N-acetylglucosamine phosphorylase
VTYEQVGDVPNVVFPNSALVDRDSDRVSVYYGAADTTVCLAHGRLSEIVELVRASASTT